ncbi:unnamed protein product, partial [Coregonus sp. 'balchen']
MMAATGRHCLPLTIDVRQTQTISAAVDEMLKEPGRMMSSLIVYAVGNVLCLANSLSFNAFKTVLEIDTMGTFYTSKVVYEKWFKVQHTQNQALQVHAGSAKAANDAMTKHLAVEWGPSGNRAESMDAFLSRQQDGAVPDQPRLLLLTGHIMVVD